MDYINLFLSLCQDNKYSKIYLAIITKAQKRISNPDQYYEKHHIVPDCFFINSNRNPKGAFLLENPNHVNNFVLLTAREHFIVHHLLCYCFSEKQLKCKMQHAFWSMTRKDSFQDRRISSRQYSSAKQHLQEARKGVPRSIESKNKTSETLLKRYSGPEGEELRKKLSLANKGKPAWNKGIPHKQETIEKFKNDPIRRMSKSKETKQKISIARTGVPHSEERKRKISENHHDVSGSNNPMYGRTHSDETKQKMSEAQKKRDRSKNEKVVYTYTPESYKKKCNFEKNKWTSEMRESLSKIRSKGTYITPWGVSHTTKDLIVDPRCPLTDPGTLGEYCKNNNKPRKKLQGKTPLELGYDFIPNSI